MEDSSCSLQCLVLFGFNGSCFKVSSLEADGSFFTFRERKLSSRTEFPKDKLEGLMIMVDWKGEFSRASASS